MATQFTDADLHATIDRMHLAPKVAAAYHAQVEAGNASARFVLTAQAKRDAKAAQPLHRAS